MFWISFKANQIPANEIEKSTAVCVCAQHTKGFVCFVYFIRELIRMLSILMHKLARKI